MSVRDSFIQIARQGTTCILINPVQFGFYSTTCTYWLSKCQKDLRKKSAHVNTHTHVCWHEDKLGFWEFKYIN